MINDLFHPCYCSFTILFFALKVCEFSMDQVLMMKFMDKRFMNEKAEVSWNKVHSKSHGCKKGHPWAS
jgi:hypothetical protein